MGWIKVRDGDGNTALVTEKAFARSFARRGYIPVAASDDDDAPSIGELRAAAAELGIEVPKRANTARVVALLRSAAFDRGVEITDDATASDLLAALRGQE